VRMLAGVPLRGWYHRLNAGAVIRLAAEIARISEFTDGQTLIGWGLHGCAAKRMRHSALAHRALKRVVLAFHTGARVS